MSPSIRRLSLFTALLSLQLGTSCFKTDVDADGDGSPVSVDCDDDNPEAFPGAAEVCDGADNDCDGLTDDADDDLDLETRSIFYGDTDGDGYGSTSRADAACTQPPGTVENDLDCDDNNAELNPDADEVCDGRDNDCDGLTDAEDDSIDPEQVALWYLDVDSDGYGDPNSPQLACEQPSRHVDNGLDCNDANAQINPDALEICDEHDNDCDGLLNDDDDSLDPSGSGLWYSDADGDGYGDPATASSACEGSSDTVAQGGDCDDGDPAIRPGIEDTCDDGLDNNCDGEVDDGCTTCGDGILDDGEEYDPAPGPYSAVFVDEETCRWDFSNVTQLYCSGSCSWAGSSGCDQADADIFCKLIMDDPNASASSWSRGTAQPTAGFPCAPLNYGTPVNVVDRGVTARVTWQDTSILGNHGGGSVILNPVCTN